MAKAVLLARRVSAALFRSAVKSCFGVIAVTPFE
jgi:hypothetical protein